MPEDAQIAADPANDVCPDFTSAIQQADDRAAREERDRDRNANKITADLRVKRTSWSNGGRQEPK